MADGNVNLKQASIVSVDLFGFARQTDDDLAKAAQAFEALNARLESTASRHNGRVFNTDAEGFFLELPTPEEALLAADEIANGPWPPVRVGVHYGAVQALYSGELAGDAVQTAAHVQQAAEKGQVLASGDIRKAVRDPSMGRRLAREIGSVGSTSVFQLTHVVPVDLTAQREAARRRMVWGGSAFVVVAGLVGLIWGQDIYTTLFPKHDHVAVMKLHGEGKDAGEFADGLTDEIGYVLNQGKVPTVLGATAESLRGSDGPHQIRLHQVGAILDGSVSGDNTALDIKLQIENPLNHQTIWSHEFKGAGDDLQTQVASRVISVLQCSSEAMSAGSNVADSDAVALYVKFCDLNSDAASDATALQNLEKSLRDLTAKAPQFSYGHSQLALFLQQKAQIDTAHAAALVAESQAEADKAIALDPKNPQGYTAKARNVAAPGWLEREKNLALATSLPSADPLPSAVYALMLAEVGRLNDAAIQSGRVASETATGDPDYVILIANSLAEQGKDDDADRDLTRALQIAPNSPVIQDFRFHMYEWFGRWDEALGILTDDVTRPASLAQEDDLAATQKFIAAVEAATPEARAAAREAEMASVAHDRSHLMAAVSHLSALGLVDDAYRLLDQTPPSAQTDDVSVLFTPLNSALRRDPRFMPLAAKLGLVDYWTKSGKWPDFCTSPGLPYNCRAEAAKVAGK